MLHRRVVKSGFWVFALRITQQVFGLARLIILARLLAPSDFGLMGIALMTMATVDTFSQTGFQAALIQKKDDVSSYLNSAWTIMLIRGIILFCILYLLAPYAAVFFNVPEARPIIRIMGLSIFLQGLINIGTVYFQKELEFNKQYIFHLSGTLADFVVVVSAAFILRSVWALVLGMLAGNLVRVAVSYMIHPYRPRLSLDMKKVKEIFGFGKWVLGSSILIFLLTQGDDILVGKLLGAAALGFYQMAYRISNIPATEITHMISQVTFPAYSKLQDNVPKLREAYLRVLRLTAFFSFPTAGLLFALAPDFTRLFLGEKWMPMVSTIRVLCIFGVTRSVAATMGSVLYGAGKPEVQTKLSSIQLIIMCFIIYPLTVQWGIIGASLAVVIPNVIALVLIIRETKIIIDCKYNDINSLVIVPFIATCISIAAVFVVLKLLPMDNAFIYMCLTIALSSIVYYGIANIWDRNFGYEIRGFFRSFR